MDPSRRGPTVRPATTADTPALDALHAAAWGGPMVVAHDRVFDLNTLPTLVAVVDGEIMGVLTYAATADSLELVSIYTDRRRDGVGSALLDAAVATGRRLGCRRLWLVTTNDNLDALRFYQRRGMRIVAVDAGAVDRARDRKPTLPVVGAYGIPMRDELTLEQRLD